jgi:hypothetical protein
MIDQPLKDTISRIEALARRDPGGRGFAAYAPDGQLLPAAATLLEGERFILLTGFCIRAAMRGETDGPPGTLALALALQRLGKSVQLLTDRYSDALLAAGAQVHGLNLPLHVLPNAHEPAECAMRALVAEFSPTHVVAIERPGAAPDGHCYSMRGEVLDDILPRTDWLLDPAAGHAHVTLAIGDGGNELGMGSLRAQLQEHVCFGERIFCATPADHAIPAGISNWGAYALAAVLSLLSGRMLIEAPQREHAVLAAMLDAGAVDGFSGRGEASVDGVAWDDYALTLAEMRACTNSALAGRHQNAM